MTFRPLPLVPLPAAVSIGGEPFSLTAETAIVIGDHPAGTESRTMTDAAAELRAIVRGLTGWGLEGTTAAAGTITLSIHGEGLGEGLGEGDRASAGAGEFEGEGRPESYRLDVTADGIRLVGADAAGLFYAVQTLGQLIEATGDGWQVPAASVGDAPRFAYRGVMLDVARHFHPVEVVEGYIDRASALKFNHLHLHLSDDQGWRLELRSRPELTARSSASAVGGAAGGFYTHDDYRRIVAYAASRHMTVVPEFDLPGHTHAVSLAYPELSEPPVITDAVRESVRAFPQYGSGALPENGTAYAGVAVGFSSLRIHDEATHAFVSDVFTELAALTPGPYLHFGGDEALGTPADDFAAFVSRTSAVIASLGKTPVAWHEAGAAQPSAEATQPPDDTAPGAAPGLAPGTIGQYWGFVEPTGVMDDRARGFVRGGGRVILSPADAVYLDMKPHDGFELGLTWARGATSVERAYSWEPSDVIAGISDADILGVEAPLWTETVKTADDIDALAFPRIAAAAEAAWSPATGTHPDRTWESFRRRVAGLGPLWSSRGIRFTASEEIPWTV